MPTRSPLITVDELSRALDDPTPPVVLDVRWSLPTGAQRDAYLTGHLPGARFVDLGADLSDPPADPVDDRGRHPLPSPERFVGAMRRVGVSEDSVVVAHDAADGTSAARLWWLLSHYWHDDVRVLDGGLAAWRAAGLGIETGEVTVAPGDFDGWPGAMTLLDADDAAALAASTGGALLDARAAERYRGETEPMDPVAGHVPGAVSLPTTGNVDADGRWLSRAELVGRMAVDHGDGLGAYCGSGVTACHTVLAGEVAGRAVALYPGSWSGWVSDPSRPVATG